MQYEVHVLWSLEHQEQVLVNRTQDSAPAIDSTLADNLYPDSMSRPPSRRQSSRRGGAGATSIGRASEGASAGTNCASFSPPKGLPKDASFTDDEDDDHYSTKQETTEGRASWYVEALQQGNSAAALDNILDAGSGPNHADQANFGTFDDHEVLEQYRIMAQHEAYIRVKENTGFDIAEYEKRRKMQGNEPSDKRGLYGGSKTPRTRLPELKKFVSASGTPKPEEPPLPTPKSNIKFLEQTQARIPELCTGITVRGGSVVPNNEHIVRCLGCRGQVRVKLLATLVSCPECNTVSPASSTRR